MPDELTKHIVISPGRKEIQDIMNRSRYKSVRFILHKKTGQIDAAVDADRALHLNLILAVSPGGPRNTKWDSWYHGTFVARESGVRVYSGVEEESKVLPRAMRVALQRYGFKLEDVEDVVAGIVIPSVAVKNLIAGRVSPLAQFRERRRMTAREMIDAVVIGEDPASVLVESQRPLVTISPGKSRTSARYNPSFRAVKKGDRVKLELVRSDSYTSLLPHDGDQAVGTMTFDTRTEEDFAVGRVTVNVTWPVKEWNAAGGKMRSDATVVTATPKMLKVALWQ